MSQRFVPGRIIIVSAPSGAGKTTLVNHLRSTLPQLVFCLSTTTRAPRKGELDGVHYRFIDTQTFKNRAANGEFAEWQEVHGNLYGTEREPIERAVAEGNHVVKEIDVYGKLKFDRSFPQNTGILIVPPSMLVLERRLRNRATDSDEVIRVRLANAAAEMEVARTQGKYRYTIVNEELERAKDELVKVVGEIIGATG